MAIKEAHLRADLLVDKIYLFDWPLSNVFLPQIIPVGGWSWSYNCYRGWAVHF